MGSAEPRAEEDRKELAMHWLGQEMAPCSQSLG